MNLLNFLFAYLYLKFLFLEKNHIFHLQQGVEGRWCLEVTSDGGMSLCEQFPLWNKRKYVVIAKKQCFEENKLPALKAILSKALRACDSKFVYTSLFI